MDVAFLFLITQEAVEREEARAGMEATASLMEKIKEAENVQRKTEATIKNVSAQVGSADSTRRAFDRLAVVVVTVKRTIHGDSDPSPTNYLARSLEPLIR